MTVTSLRELFVEQIQDMYSAETQLVEALPKMAEAATNEDLRVAFRNHLAETRNHVERLKDVLAELDEKPGGKVCMAMQGLVKEGEEVIHQQGNDVLRDVGLIAAAQRVEHYEISAYGTAATLAKHLDLPVVMDLLRTTLDEEASADTKLTTIAEGGWITSGVNREAAEVSK